MGKKSSLKATLLSQQERLKKKAKAQEASLRSQKQDALKTKGQGRLKHEAAAAVASSATTSKSKSKSASKTRVTKQTIMPFRPTDKILLIGEGNFSFALSLLSQPTPALAYLPPGNVTATALDAEDACVAKYPEARAIVDELRARGAEVLFGVDATKLEKCKALRKRRWDRIVWNFPHAGKGITDQARNILANQTLLLGFLRSAAPFLAPGPVPNVLPPRKKRKKGGDAEEDSDADNRETHAEESADMSDGEDFGAADFHARQEKRDGARGTILITLRNVPPYTEWDLPRLAKKPPLSLSSSFSSTSNPTSKLHSHHQPRYTQLRSFRFVRSAWPGYAHRMTKGLRRGPTGEEGTTGIGGEDRTWEFCLADVNGG